MSQESLLCPLSVHLHCVSGLLGQALPRVSKAQIRDSICTSFSLMSSSSSSCFGKPVPMLSREFCGGDGGKGDQQKDEGRLATHFSALQSSLAAVRTSPCTQSVPPYNWSTGPLGHQWLWHYRRPAEVRSRRRGLASKHLPVLYESHLQSCEAPQILN